METLYYQVLVHFNDPDAARVRRQFDARTDSGHFMARFEMASPALKRDAVEMCLNVILQSTEESEAKLDDAVDIVFMIVSRAHLQHYIRPHQKALEDYLLDEGNLKSWCSHVRGPRLLPQDNRRDLWLPAMLHMILRRLGSTRAAEAREYITKHAIDDVLRAAISR
jgi:hypothetical protein